MFNKKFAKEALNSCKNKYECRFDGTFAPIKRNLWFFAIMSLAAINVSTIDGVYKINLGVISGVIKEPEIVFIGLLLICFYHVYLFWLKCRATIINSTNFHKVDAFFMYELAGKHAFAEWHEVLKQSKTKVNIGLGSFSQRSPLSPRINGNYIVRGDAIPNSFLESQSNFYEALQKSDSFKVSESRGMAYIDYTFSPSIEDEQFLTLHRDHFWITKKSQFIEYVLPLIAGMIAVIFLVNKVVSLIGI